MQKVSGMKSLVASYAGAKLEAALHDFANVSRPHTPVLSELALAARYRVSPGTVRRSIAKLVAAGVFYRKPRSGTFVAERSQAGAGTVVYADSWHDLEHPFYREHLRGLLAGAGALGMKLEVLDCGPQLANRERLFKDVGRPEVVGAIVPWCNLGMQALLLQANPRLRLVAMVSQRTPPGVCFAGIDYVGVGSHAAYYLIPRLEGLPGAALGVMTQPAAVVGFQENCLAQQMPHETLLIQAGKIPDAAAVAAQIRQIRPAGLAFDDDLLAAAVLRRLEQPELPTISLANAGTESLPPWVARLEVDGRKLGRLIMQTMAGIDSEHLSTDMALLLRPVLRLPPNDSSREGV